MCWSMCYSFTKESLRSPKYITKKEIEKVARPGETYAQVAERIKKLRENL
jgi:hypothetical protein